MTGLAPTADASRSWVRGLVLVVLLGVGLALVLSAPAMGADDGGQAELNGTDASAPAETDGADLQLTSVEYPDTIEHDETLEITYGIENVGNETGTESFVDLLVEGSLVDRRTNVTLDPGDSGTATFVYDGVENQFDPGDTITFTVELSDFGDSVTGTTDIGTVDQSGTLDLREPVQTDTVSVTVDILTLDVADEPGWLEVENTDNAAPAVQQSVTEGALVTVPVEDIGGVAVDDSITVRLTADSEGQEVLDTATTTVEAGDNEPVANFQWTPGVPEVGQPVAFDAGNTLGSGSDIVEYRWDFTGDGEFDSTTGSQTTEFVFLEEGVTNVTLVVENEAGLTGEDTTPITVRGDPAESALSELDVAGQGGAATVSSGDEEDVSVVVTNVGGEADTFDVTLDIDGSITESRTTGELDTDDEEVVTFEGVTADLDTGAYDVTVSTADDEVSGTLAVETPAEPDFEFDVEIIETNSPTEGDDLTVTATIENVGTDSGTGTVSLDAGELGADTATVTLASGESTNETFTVSTAEGDAGDYEVTVTTGSDASATTVTIGGDDGSLFTPTLIFVLLLVVLLGAGAYYYYVHDQQQSSDGMDPL